MEGASTILAANLRRYRSARRLSQQALADEAGLSRIGYRDIEVGKVSPRADTLERIAGALGVNVQDLLTPVRTLTHVRFRAQKRMTTRELILSDAAKWLDDYRELEDLLDEKISWPLDGVAEWALGKRSGIERALEAASRARAALGLKRGDHEELIRDVGGLLEDNGVKVLTADVKSEGFFGLSIGPEDDGPAVFVNVWDRVSVERWIFTAAHELAHLILHPGAYDVARSDEVEDEEREADAFAGYFLMPPALFDAEWHEARGLGLVDRVFKIKRIFRVSWQTVLYRVAAPLDPGSRKDLWTRFRRDFEREYGRALGRIEEPEGLDRNAFLSRPPVSRAADEPARLADADFREDRLQRLVRLAIERQSITMSRAAEILDYDLRGMRELAASWVG